MSNAEPQGPSSEGGIHISNRQLLIIGVVALVVIAVVVAAGPVKNMIVGTKNAVQAGAAGAQHEAETAINAVPEARKQKIISNFISNGWQAQWQPVGNLDDMKYYWYDDSKTSVVIEGTFNAGGIEKVHRLHIFESGDQIMVEDMPVDGQ